MPVYIGLVCLCAFVGAQMNKSKSRSNKRYMGWMAIAFLGLFIISGLRFEVGKDYATTYVVTYRLVQANFSNIRMDSALILIYKLMDLFNANVQWIFVITSFIINYFVCRSITDQSKNIGLSFWIYMCGVFYFFSMNGVRQSITIAIFYYSLKYVKENNIKRYMALNIVGCFFHMSAIMFLPLYFFLTKEFKSKTKFLALGVAFLGGSFIIPLISSLLLKTKFAMYLTNGAYSAQETLNFSMVLNILFFLLYEIVLKKKYNRESIIYSNVHFVGVLVSLLTTSLPLVIRIFVSFRFIEYLSVPNLIETHFHNRYRKLICLGAYVLYFLYFLYAIGIQNGNTVLPYKTIFG